ncbi:MAG: hydroxyacid dehydrogenase [Candidatus Colwellbacteria bacterium]|nr:hydroxyacid dehydrogenase [Candidatus Colwellbacteria bacterium]
MAKIAFYGVQPWEQEYLERSLQKHQLTFCPEYLDEKKSLERSDTEIISVFVDSNVSKKIIDLFPSLKFIATRSTGFDHIDLETCKERGIAVSNVPSYGDNTVAEYVFALILALSRKIYIAYEQVREEGDFSYDALQGFDLLGKTMGVIGTGRIGKYTARIAKGFGMRVLAYDIMPDRKFARKIGVTYVSLEELLKESDIVSIHVPYAKETHHLIDKNKMALMKKGAYLINTSRGAVVDTQALVVALKSGQLSGAGLDVLEEEDAIKDEVEFLLNKKVTEHDLRNVIANHILVDIPNVIITPHTAFNTKEALMRILDTTVANINSYLKRKPQNCVN